MFSAAEKQVFGQVLERSYGVIDCSIQVTPENWDLVLALSRRHYSEEFVAELKTSNKIVCFQGRMILDYLITRIITS